jgi:hypothetical protein
MQNASNEFGHARIIQIIQSRWPWLWERVDPAAASGYIGIPRLVSDARKDSHVLEGFTLR